MLRRTARTEHPEVAEIVASDHCIARFRQRSPVRDPGIDIVMDALILALEAADVSRVPPSWAVSDRPAALWAATPDLAFPLAKTPQEGRWIAITCLRRERA
jgi:hypothetical protein